MSIVIGDFTHKKITEEQKNAILCGLRTQGVSETVLWNGNLLIADNVNDLGSHKLVIRSYLDGAADMLPVANVIQITRKKSIFPEV